MECKAGDDQRESEYGWAKVSDISQCENDDHSSGMVGFDAFGLR